MMTAVSLERRQGLLRAAEVAVLQILPDLAERTRERCVRVGGGALAAILQLTERRVGLLGIGETSGVERGRKLIERLAEVGLTIGGLARRLVGNSRDRHWCVSIGSGSFDTPEYTHRKIGPKD